MPTAGHRRFAAAWDWMSRHEGKAERAFRLEVAGGVRGRVLEIGYGVGSNWEFIPPDAEYTGIEPDPYMRSRAEHRIPGGGRFTLLDAGAEALPFEDASFDTVLATLVFCTIPDAPAALAEVRRVLRPQGSLRFWEHVRAHGRIGSSLQDAVTPLWKRTGGGCHPNRDTESAIRTAGFDCEELRRTKLGPFPAIVGVARLQPNPEVQ